jgi:hypothetical protein
VLGDLRERVEAACGYALGADEEVTLFGRCPGRR